MNNKIDSLSVTNTHDVVIENVAQDNVLQTNDIQRDIRVVGNANTLVPEKIALFDQMVVELPHREVVKWYENNVKDMSLEEIKHMQGKVYPCIRFDAQAKLDEIKARFGDQVKIYVKKTGWSGIKEVDIKLTGEDITAEDVQWVAAKVKNIPLRSLKFIKCEKIKEIDLSIFSILNSVSFNRCRYLKEIKGLGAHSLQNFDDLSGLSNLKVLKIADCLVMNDIPGLSNLIHLEHLELDGINYAFNKIPDLSKLIGLRYLRLEELGICGITIPGLSKLTKLEELRVRECGPVSNVEDCSQLTRLKSLAINDSARTRREHLGNSYRGSCLGRFPPDGPA